MTDNNQFDILNATPQEHFDELVRLSKLDNKFQYYRDFRDDMFDILVLSTENTEDGLYEWVLDKSTQTMKFGPVKGIVTDNYIDTYKSNDCHHCSLDCEHCKK